jgi:WD40 repeat protein
LITEELNNVEIKNDKPFPEAISLFDPDTGEIKVYAIRTTTGASPSWLPDLNAVVYPTITYTSIDKKNGSSKFTRQLWVSYGDPNIVQILDDNLLQFPVAVNLGGSEILYLSDKKISKLDKSLKKLSALAHDSVQWDYGKGWRNRNPVSYKMTWQPNTALIFLYSSGGSMGGGGYTFILNADTGNICELDLGGWVSEARWSSDGRYLAVGRATDSHPADLTLLDATTGNLTALRGVPQGTEGILYVNDFIWAPDNRHLLAIGSVVSPQNFQTESSDAGLHLVDIASGQSVRIVPEHKGFAFSQDKNFVWSPNGAKLAIHCPTQTTDQICLIPVQKLGQ